MSSSGGKICARFRAPSWSYFPRAPQGHAGRDAKVPEETGQEPTSGISFPKQFENTGHPARCTPVQPTTSRIEVLCDNTKLLQLRKENGGDKEIKQKKTQKDQPYRQYDIFFRLGYRAKNLPANHQPGPPSPSKETQAFRPPFRLRSSPPPAVLPLLSPRAGRRARNPHSRAMVAGFVPPGGWDLGLVD